MPIRGFWTTSAKPRAISQPTAKRTSWVRTDPGFCV
jgi:hypothetical protein